MLPNQKAAVDGNMVELTVINYLLIVDYMMTRGTISSDERDLVESKVTNTGKQIELFRLLKEKDQVWSQLLSFLRERRQTTLADKLRKDARGNVASGANGDQMTTRSALEEFSAQLAEYYINEYSNVPTMGESPKHVNDVWVPLRIDGEELMTADGADHIELLKRLKSTQRRNVALIKGDPGMGKTTLAKKIAYDWAVNYGTTEAQQFSLVLAVPLRSAGKSPRFDQLAIDHFLKILDLDDFDEEELKREIKLLKSNLLVILDGLDEYKWYSESPLKDMFAAPFKHLSANCNEPLKMISFKLIITSRPYACERINDDFWPIECVVLPLDANHLRDFVNLYCNTSEGIVKVTEYLKINAKLVIKVPLILTFVCYLADNKKKIPTNMTRLYGKLVRQMIWREIRQGKLDELIDIHKRKESNVVKTTGELAWRMTINNEFEFNDASLVECHVTNDSFICGFLLHKYDVKKFVLKGEFPHRSIQEFFAALHCYQLMLSGCKDELEVIRQLIAMRDSQFGRFLFGICSQEEQFVQLYNWLSPSLGYFGNTFWSPAVELNQFGSNFLDCSYEENILMGQKLLQSLDYLGEKLARNMYASLHIRNDVLRLHDWPDGFKEGLHLVDLARNSSDGTVDWALINDQHIAQLAVISDGMSQLLEKKIAQINILIWTPLVYRAHAKWFNPSLRQIQSLPPVRSLIMSMADKASSADTIVCIRIGYERMTSQEMTNFRFEYVNTQGNVREMLDAVPEEKMVKLKQTEITRIKREGGSVFYINLTVESCPQFALIFSLIRLSLS